MSHILTVVLIVLIKLINNHIIVCTYASTIGLFTYQKDSGYYWFSNGAMEDSYNEYYLVGLVSTSHNVHSHTIYVTRWQSN